uniref:Uncharacterized protein n=1 Tax=Cacopsylla melanoneura TaxID=428564 RepID=A0A8D8TLX8_9HEMI
MEKNQPGFKSQPVASPGKLGSHVHILNGSLSTWTSQESNDCGDMQAITKEDCQLPEWFNVQSVSGSKYYNELVAMNNWEDVTSQNGFSHCGVRKPCFQHRKQW